MSIDPTDDLIEALVTARERGLSRVEAHGILRDVFDAPWSTATVDRFAGKSNGHDPYPLRQVQP